MSHRVIASIFLGLSLICIGTGYLILHPVLLGICPQNISGTCLNQDLVFGVGKPLYWSTYWLPMIFLVLIFVSKEVFTFWWRLTLPIAIIGFILIANTPPLGQLFGPDRTTMTAWVVKCLVVFSAALIALRYSISNFKKNPD